MCLPALPYTRCSPKMRGKRWGSALPLGFWTLRLHTEEVLGMPAAGEAEACAVTAILMEPPRVDDGDLLVAHLAVHGSSPPEMNASRSVDVGVGSLGGTSTSTGDTALAAGLGTHEVSRPVRSRKQPHGLFIGTTRRSRPQLEAEDATISEPGGLRLRFGFGHSWGCRRSGR